MAFVNCRSPFSNILVIVMATESSRPNETEFDSSFNANLVDAKHPNAVWNAHHREASIVRRRCGTF